MALTDQEKIKGFKILTVAAIAVIVVMGVMLAYDNYKLVKFQYAYRNGWNACAKECNDKISQIYDNDRIPDIVVIPQSNDTFNVSGEPKIDQSSDDVVIQLV